MMTTKETGSESGRNTRMCGDPKMWFPMRVTYQREMKVKAELDRLGIENFVPMRYKVVERQNDGDAELRRVLVPAINNLIFVRSTQERVTSERVEHEGDGTYSQGLAPGLCYVAPAGHSLSAGHRVTPSGVNNLA